MYLNKPRILIYWKPINMSFSTSQWSTKYVGRKLVSRVEMGFSYWPVTNTHSLYLKHCTKRTINNYS